MNKMETKTGSLLDELLDSITPLEQSKVDTRMLLAAKIADGMKAKGWKNKDLLKAVGKENPSIITKWLSGTHNFTTDTLVELEDALGINLLDRFEKKTEVVIHYYISIESESEAVYSPSNCVKELNSTYNINQAYLTENSIVETVISNLRS